MYVLAKELQATGDNHQTVNDKYNTITELGCQDNAALVHEHAINIAQ